jgi:hypothetical protein
VVFVSERFRAKEGVIACASRDLQASTRCIVTSTDLDYGSEGSMCRYTKYCGRSEQCEGGLEGLGRGLGLGAGCAC